jgi:glycosyltransferase involved in cell wall biosynthesis
VLSVSVVTPSFNQARFIQRTIESVLSQNYPGLEYIACDGGSTDASLSILEHYRNRMSFVTEPDSGQANAVNKGIRATAGEVIGWLNSDDVYLPAAVARATQFLDAHQQVDVVYGDAQLIDTDDRVTGSYYTEPWRPSRLLERCYLCQPAVFFRRRVVERFGYLHEDLRYTLDYEYWLRLSQGGATFAYLPDTLAAWRLHPETKSLSARLAVHQELNSMLRSRLGRVPDSWLLNHAHTVVELRGANAHARFPTPYAIEVILAALRLSLEWNGTISRGLLPQAFGPLLGGFRRRLARRQRLTRPRA